MRTLGSRLVLSIAVIGFMLASCMSAQVNNSEASQSLPPLTPPPLSQVSKLPEKDECSVVRKVYGCNVLCQDKYRGICTRPFKDFKECSNDCAIGPTDECITVRKVYGCNVLCQDKYRGICTPQYRDFEACSNDCIE